MFNKTLYKKMQHSIYDATCTIETKIDNYKDIINSLMNKQEMLIKMQHSIYDATCTIETKIDNYKDIINSLMNKQEMLIKAINEDRLVITKILEHLEKLETKGKK